VVARRTRSEFSTSKVVAERVRRSGPGMDMNERKAGLVWAAILLLFISTSASAHQTAKPYTVADEIGITLFDTPTGTSPGVQFSPDGHYFVVWAERGNLDANDVEDSLRFYRTGDVQDFLRGSDRLQPPAPAWTVIRSGREGPVVTDWRWLADSSGLAFLERMPRGNQRLVVAELRRKVIEALTPNSDSVEAFDALDRNDYAYTVAALALRKTAQTESNAAAVVGTGHTLFGLLLPNDPVTSRYYSSPHRVLWAVFGGKRFEVGNDHDAFSQIGQLTLSPNGRVVVATLPVPEVPQSWETLYPPPYVSDPHRIHAGSRSVQQYVQIDLQTGAIRPLTNAPLSMDAGWLAHGNPRWSRDGQEILLPNTFLESKDGKPSRPCVALLNVPANVSTCIEALKGETVTGYEDGFNVVSGVRFVGNGKEQVIVTFHSPIDSAPGYTVYKLVSGGVWQAVRQTKGEPITEHDGLEIRIGESFSEPPTLIASEAHISRVIWDPNPQLEAIALGRASVYTWKDKEGQEWSAGLFEPNNYERGRRYPLVIQTHGFVQSQFRPSGVFPTAFAARALAAAGMFVLQIQQHCPLVTQEEGPCTVSNYESAANQLVAEGLVDPTRIGIIGFSRSCFYVMEALTTASIHIAAASITDGLTADYFQYLQNPERQSTEVNSMIGAAPFGAGLQQWVRRSPGFNLDKVTTPLLVVAAGPVGVLSMWQPYVGLRYLQKPVELIMLHTDEHVLTNPAVRMASQGGSVDWFRFWLQGYEDPDPAKAEQYRRWEQLCDMRVAANPGQSTFCVPTKAD
jgi:hypothetical protein